MWNDELRSVLIGTAGLSVAAVAAIVLTVRRGRISASPNEAAAVARAAIIAVLFQSAHFLEELATGFHQRFPELLGLSEWSGRFFVTFNLFWLALWTISIWSLPARRSSALFTLWFLALAGCANGVAHPLLSARVGGYFPGLVTSPFVGMAGATLLRRLLFATRHHD